ncbi:4Fe-4S binding protein [Halodesulfovibrio sp.]|uniref:4Fe-4S binding protein n=1 Tax=Halodesulfovibrio sp. TaxID=1912772 RepID=UPI00343385C2
MSRTCRNKQGRKKYYLKRCKKRHENTINHVFASSQNIFTADTSSHKTLAVDHTRCIQCKICQKICPNNAIVLEKVVRIDSGKCRQCGACVVECPSNAIYFI